MGVRLAVQEGAGAQEAVVEIAAVAAGEPAVIAKATVVEVMAKEAEVVEAEEVEAVVVVVVVVAAVRVSLLVFFPFSKSISKLIVYEP